MINFCPVLGKSLSEILDDSFQSQVTKICLSCSVDTLHNELSCIEHHPNILVIAINRFHFGISARKNNTGVLLNRHIVHNSIFYDLIGSVHHHGSSTSSGHYTSKVYFTNVVYLCNDQSVSEFQSTEDRFENLLDEDVLINDGVHLNREGAKLMLKAITDALGEMTPQPSGSEQKTERRATDSDNKMTIKMTVNAETANHIVGKKGATVIRIERMFHVKVRNQREGQECHFTISGTEQEAKDAQNYIRNIIENTKKRYDPELPICRYHADKRCRNKDKCKFLHPAEGAQKRKRSAERPTRKSPPKKTQRRDRSRSNQAKEKPLFSTLE